MELAVDGDRVWFDATPHEIGRIEVGFGEGE
jgi:hypothetical protein